MKLTLYLEYRTPTLNLTKRQHWTQQYREKRKAWVALRSAIDSAASDPSIPTTLRALLKTSQMAFAAADSFPVTIPLKSPLSLSRKK